MTHSAMPKNKKKSDKALPETEIDVSLLSPFEWNEQRNLVVTDLAQGFTVDETATKFKINPRTIYRWKNHPDFIAEMDRLSLMVDIASRAERLRLAMKVVRKIGEKTEKDLLDWLKYAQGETDGVKLDLTKLSAAFGADEEPLAGRGQGGTGTKQIASPADAGRG